MSQPERHEFSSADAPAGRVSGISNVVDYTDTRRAISLILLTLVLQSTNFVFDWKNLDPRPGFNVNYDLMVGDNSHYFGIAKNLLSGNGYVDSAPEIMSAKPGTSTYLRTPGLPLLYTIPLFVFCRDTGYEIVDSNTTQVWLFLWLVNTALLCLGAVCFYRLCSLLLGDPRFGYLGALLYVVWPANLVFLSPSLAKFSAETVIAPLLVWMFYLLLNGKSRWPSAFFAGVILGYCVLARVYLILLPVFLLVAAALLRSPLLRRKTMITAIVALLVFLPWPIRNYVVFHDFALSSQGGTLLWFGNNAYARGSIDGRMYDEGFRNPDRFPPLEQLERKYPGLVSTGRYSETEAKAILQREALGWMKQNLGALPWLFARKLAITFYPANFGSDNRVNFLTASIFLAFVPGLILYVYHCIKGSAHPELLLLLLPILCVCIVTVVFFAEYRTRLLAEPPIIAFALYGLRHMVPYALLYSGAARRAGRVSV